RGTRVTQAGESHDQFVQAVHSIRWNPSGTLRSGSPCGEVEGRLAARAGHRSEMAGSDFARSHTE
ncbi:MAG: hypothetical protein ACK55I_44885, partial [bacterium]